MSINTNIKLKYVARFAYGKTLAKNPDAENEIPAYGSNGQFDFNSYANVQPPAIIIGRKGSYGKLTWVDEPVFATDTTFFVDRRFSKSNLRWLFYALSTLELDAGTEEAAVPGLSREKAYNKMLWSPPCPQQTAIADFLDRETARIDGLIEKEQRLLALLEEKRTALISHAVTKGLNPDAELKDSGIEWLGRIPKDWEESKLSYLVLTRKGIAFKSADFDDDGVYVIKASDIKKLTLLMPSTFLHESFLEKYPKAILRSRELILSTVGSAPEVKNSAVGQIARVPNELAGSLLNQNTVVFSPRKKFLNNDYLYYLLQTTSYRDHLDLHAHGTANQASLNVSDMLEFKIPLPPLKMQSILVDTLDAQTARFDALKAKIIRAIELLREKRTALISAAVTGKIEVVERSLH